MEKRVDVRPAAEWKTQLRATLPMFGHRNWVVIADAAYPAQSRHGIDILLCEDGHLDAVGIALKTIAGFPHLRAVPYIDRELAFVDEGDAPGIGAYRQQLGAIFNGSRPRQLAHDEILARLDEAARQFRVLVIKTGLHLPYTSVFLELDCGYWNAEAEQRMRSAM